MSAPPTFMVTFPAVALWVASGGALSVPAAIVAVALLATIVLTCLVAGRLSVAKGGRHDDPTPRP